MSSFSRNINTIQDYQEVVSALENYVEGLRTGNIEKLQKSFHQDAIMYGHWEGHLIEGDIKNLYDSVERHGSAPDLKAHIDVLHKTTTTALGRIEYEGNAAGKDGIDYHSLLKIKGEWVVISKVFHVYDK
ncbi:ACT domain-containing protein [Pedobacter cryoconitis]|uniref:ACT domain-containing protein n=1 Tax=Pedobacter cryoconitis TaxID=188932 RepID=A0A7W8YW53_9SPHI|nr:nuclear transport factor 2 family protein [Pedobacter cryoconitis]MBB5622880.1 ACT domain-containing protein [Pedobacter cryoconitis]